MLAFATSLATRTLRRWNLGPPDPLQHASAGHIRRGSQVFCLSFHPVCIPSISPPWSLARIVAWAPPIPCQLDTLVVPLARARDERGIGGRRRYVGTLWMAQDVELGSPVLFKPRMPHPAVQSLGWDEVAGAWPTFHPVRPSVPTGSGCGIVTKSVCFLAKSSKSRGRQREQAHSGDMDKTNKKNMLTVRRRIKT